MPFNTETMYWIVGNKPGEIFSLAAADYLPLNDTGYESWVAGGNYPTNILCDGELAHVLIRAGLQAKSRAAGVTSLGGLSPTEVTELVKGYGVEVTSTSSPNINAIYEINGLSWDNMKDEALFIAINSEFSGEPTPTELPWPARDKVVMFTTTAQFLAITKALGNYLSNLAQWAGAGGEGNPPTIGAITIA